MNVSRSIGIVVLATATAGITGSVIANGTDLRSNGSQSSTDVNSNSAAQLGTDKSPTQHRIGDSTAQRGTNNSAAQMGSGVNANPGAQLDNETQPTSTPPVDSDSNAPETPVPTDSRK